MRPKRRKHSCLSETDSGGRDDSPGVSDPTVTESTVRDRAVRLLAIREHGREELRRKLLQRELPPDLIQSVLDKLAEEGLQCEARFAESYTRMRVERCFGANKIRADLQSRGVDQSTVEHAIKNFDVDWSMRAYTALDKKFTRQADPDRSAEVKMQRYLYQRGYEMTEIRSAIKAFLNESTCN